MTTGKARGEVKDSEVREFIEEGALQDATGRCERRGAEREAGRAAAGAEIRRRKGGYIRSKLGPVGR